MSIFTKIFNPIQKLLYNMVKSLSEIDPLYKKTVSKLNKDKRLYYCNQVLDKAQFVHETGKNYLIKKHKKELIEKIIATQKEIGKINEEQVQKPIKKAKIT